MPQGSGILQDLSFLVKSRKRRNTYKLVPFIVVTLVAVLTADVLLLTQPQTATTTGEAARATPRQTPLAQQRPLRQQQPATTTQPVAPLSKLHKPNLFVLTRKPFTDEMLRKVAKLSGVRALELADAASITLDGKRVQTLAVNPSTFRSYTPKVTASSDALWQNVAAGDVAVSFVLGNDGGLPLHSRVAAGSARQLRIGAYATTGFGAVDAVVSRDVGRALGLPRDNALIVSAPKADSDTLRKRILQALGKGTQVAEVNPVLPKPRQNVTRRSWPAGSFMTGEQLTVALKAAVSKLGRPYVWGAEGPDTFDCSGLVQWAYGQAGVRMPRVTHQQWVTGPQVPFAQAQPGDLLFWRNDPTNPDYISHVAIYWGEGKMLHAPRTGDVVKIAPVSTRNLAGVVRVSPVAAAKVR